MSSRRKGRRVLSALSAGAATLGERLADACGGAAECERLADACGAAVEGGLLVADACGDAAECERLADACGDADSAPMGELVAVDQLAADASSAAVCARPTLT